MKNIIGKIFNKVLPFFLSKKKSLLAAISWTCAIIIIIGIPGNSIPKVHKWVEVFQPDKFVHIGIFGLLSLLWMMYLLHYKLFISSRIFIILILGSLFSIITELLQYYVFIGRNANIPDAIADIIGIVSGVFIFNLINKKNNSDN